MNYKERIEELETALRRVQALAISMGDQTSTIQDIIEEVLAPKPYVFNKDEVCTCFTEEQKRLCIKRAQGITCAPVTAY